MPVSESPDPPKNTVCHGKQKSDTDGDGSLNLWSVIANTPHGKIPGEVSCIFIGFLTFVMLFKIVNTNNQKDWHFIILTRLCNKRCSLLHL